MGGDYDHQKEVGEAIRGEKVARKEQEGTGDEEELQDEEYTE